MARVWLGKTVTQLIRKIKFYTAVNIQLSLPLCQFDFKILYLYIVYTCK